MTEIKSTEKLCSDLKTTNDRMSSDGARSGRFQQAGKLVVGSKDVEVFYPSKDMDLAAEELKLEVEELKKENGDLREMMQSLEEKIEKVASSRQ